MTKNQKTAEAATALLALIHGPVDPIWLARDARWQTAEERPHDKARRRLAGRIRRSRQELNRDLTAVGGALAR